MGSRPIGGPVLEVGVHGGDEIVEGPVVGELLPAAAAVEREAVLARFSQWGQAEARIGEGAAVGGMVGACEDEVAAAEGDAQTGGGVSSGQQGGERDDDGREPEGALGRHDGECVRSRAPTQSDGWSRRAVLVLTALERAELERWSRAGKTPQDRKSVV